MTLAAEPAATAHRFAQSATLRNLLPLTLKNALFTLLTLTLYRFWARTDVRKRLWSTTSILGDPLEYSGRGWELFRGFLISIPVFFLPAIFVLYIAPFVFDVTAASLMAFVFYLAIVPMIALAVYLMRRYQLSRTRWRGIRLALDGSPVGYAFASAGWSILEGVTLGWYTPAARMRRAKIIWENTRFGDQPFQFALGETALARGLTGPYALGWFGVPISLIVGAVITALILLITAPLTGWAFTPPDPTAAPPAPTATAFVLPALFFAISGLFLALCWTPYNAAAMNRTAELLELDGARFRLNAHSISLYGVTLAGIFIFVFSLGLLAPLSGMLQVRYVFNRLEMIGTPRFAEIGQSRIVGPQSGEGFADAFDLDFGVGVV